MSQKIGIIWGLLAEKMMFEPSERCGVGKQQFLNLRNQWNLRVKIAEDLSFALYCIWRIGWCLVPGDLIIVDSRHEDHTTERWPWNGDISFHFLCTYSISCKCSSPSSI